MISASRGNAVVKMSKVKTTWQRVRDQVVHDYRSAEAESTGRLGAFEWGALLVTTLGLVVMNFGGTPAVFVAFAELTGVVPSAYWELGHLVFWVGACVLGYVVVPVIFLLVMKRNIGDYYINPRGFSAHLWPYLALFIPASALVYWVSFWPEFQAIYPFYTLAGRSWFDLIMWELAYGVQFLALEFFFRGFLLESLRKALGMGAIAIMLIPYCMIHFPKTAAESLGSVVAGLLLGYLAMRGRSIWGGVLLHWLIAIEMDVLSLMQQGALPRL